MSQLNFLQFLVIFTPKSSIVIVAQKGHSCSNVHYVSSNQL